MDVWRILGFTGDLEKIEKEYLDTIEINDSFYEFIETVKTHYKLAIISNDSSRWSHYLRKKFDINKYFDVISISGDMKMKKPDERIFKYTIHKLGCRPDECVYVDDRLGNLEAANKVGMRGVLFNSSDTPHEGHCVCSFQELKDSLSKTMFKE